MAASLESPWYISAPLDLAFQAFQWIGIGYAVAGFRRVYCEVDA